VSADLVRLFEDIDRESDVAMEKGLTREDDSKGYALLGVSAGARATVETS
jgi:hypothetical protein